MVGVQKNLQVWLIATLSALLLIASANAYANENDTSLYLLTKGHLDVIDFIHSDADRAYYLERGEVIRLFDSKDPKMAFIFAANAQGELTGLALKLPPGMAQNLLKITHPLAARLDLGTRKVTTIFREPGHSWTDCQKHPDLCMAWPNKKTEIEVLNSRLVETMDPVRHESLWVNFYFVHYAYVDPEKTEHHSGNGWISSDFVEIMGFEKEALDEKPSEHAVRTNKEANASASANHPLDAQLFPEFTEIFQALDAKVGQCFLNRQNETPVLPFIPSNLRPYDALIWPQMKKSQASTVGQRTISAEQIILIDALARTIYGEMAVCWQYATQYLSAVAAVVKNRENNICDQKSQTTDLFTDADDAKRPRMLAVLLKSQQFTVWERTVNHHPNPSLPQVLCPPSRKGQIFYTGYKPQNFEMSIWQESLKNAIAAVLYPDEFQRTVKVPQCYYTSGLGQFIDMHRHIPIVGGVTLGRSKCMEFWSP